MQEVRMEGLTRLVDLDREAELATVEFDGAAYVNHPLTGQIRDLAVAYAHGVRRHAERDLLRAVDRLPMEGAA
jgi:hypothetical protein